MLARSDPSARRDRERYRHADLEIELPRRHAAMVGEHRPGGRDALPGEFGHDLGDRRAEVLAHVAARDDERDHGGVHRGALGDNWRIDHRVLPDDSAARGD